MIELALTGFCIILIIAVFYLLALILDKDAEIGDLTSELEEAHKQIKLLGSGILAYEEVLKHSQPRSPETGRYVKKGTVINKEV